MRKIIISVFFLACSLYLPGQHQRNFHESVNNSLTTSDIDGISYSLSVHELVGYPGKEMNYFRKDDKGTFWVLDSLISYRVPWNEPTSDWVFSGKTLNLLHDDTGNLLNSIYYTFDVNESLWVRRDSTVVTYFPGSDQQHVYHRKLWDTQTQQWADSASYIQYSSTGKQLLNVTIVPWAKSKNFFTYNENDDLINRYALISNTENLQWINNWQLSFTYNTSGLLIQDVHQDWDQSSQEWVNSWGQLYDYDEQGNRVVRIVQDWNKNTEEWINSNQELFVYNTDGWIIEKTNQTWENDAWMNDRQTFLSYNENGLVTEEVLLNWDTGLQDWVNFAKSETLYHSDENVLTYLSQKWDELLEEWVNYYRFQHSYNDDGSLSSTISGFWDSEESDWKENNFAEYFYDENGNLIEFISQSWDDDLQDWKNSINEKYFWSELGGQSTSISDLSNSEIKIFPNPVRDHLYFKNTIDGEIENITLYSVSGKQVKSIPLGHTQMINVSDLSGGVYFLKVEFSNGKVMDCKFIKQ